MYFFLLISAYSLSILISFETTGGEATLLPVSAMSHFVQLRGIAGPW